MEKAVSVAVSILLLAAAEWASVEYKRAKLGVPERDQKHGCSATNDIRLTAGRQGATSNYNAIAELTETNKP